MRSMKKLTSIKLNRNYLLSTLLAGFFVVIISTPTSSAVSLKCLSRPALVSSLSVAKITLEGLKKSLPSQLLASQALKKKIDPALAAYQQAYKNYQASPSPDNENKAQEKKLAYQAVVNSYKVQYNLYLGQKAKIPGLITKVKTLEVKVASLSKECNLVKPNI